jgi:osmotically inducible protein OsmC
MSELRFPTELSWSGSGREGGGRIAGEDVALEYSVPASMGGRGAGTNPEELLVCAVATCYSATLTGVLRRAGLPVTELRTAATGTVTGYPTTARFAGVVVSPTIVGGDPARADAYRAAAEAAHDRCFVGHTLAAEVDYHVGAVTVEPTAAAA